MLFNYQALENSGKRVSGSVEAISADVAVGSLQKRGLIVVSLEPEREGGWWQRLGVSQSIPTRDVVILSRQVATLFEARVSAMKAFSLLAEETENQALAKNLGEVVSDIQSGATISKALSKHPEAFSNFYVNMVKSGEETGKLNEVFNYLADHMDRNYEVVSKVRNALVYPAFVIGVFIAVMVLMFTVIVPKISAIIVESGSEVPIYTKIVFGISAFITNYGILLLIALIVSGFFLVRYLRTSAGRSAWSSFNLGLPHIGNLYRKLYLSVIADNMNTMILSGIPMVKAIEITSAVVDNETYKEILDQALVAVKGGSSLSNALAPYREEVPSMFSQMIKVGEETGELGKIFQTMAKFYQREVINAVNTLVSLIEPVMIALLGVGVGVILASVLIPIYDIASSAGL